jgi:hypothetical protein
LTAVFERQLEAKERPPALRSDIPTQVTLVAELDTALKHGVEDSKTGNGTLGKD